VAEGEIAVGLIVDEEEDGVSRSTFTVIVLFIDITGKERR
jgi:hypothetical protein